MSHIEQVAAMFTVRLAGIADVVCFEEQDWPGRPGVADDRLHGPFGYMPARRTEDDEEEIVELCPAIIARQSDWLIPDERRAYWTALILHVLMHVVHRGDDDVEMIADRHLHDSDPTALALVNRVQFGALA